MLEDIPQDCDSEEGLEMDLPLRKTDKDYEESGAVNIYESGDGEKPNLE